MRTYKSIYFLTMSIAVLLWAAPAYSIIYEGPNGEVYYGDYLPHELYEKGYRPKSVGRSEKKAPMQQTLGHDSTLGSASGAFRTIEVSPAIPIHKKSKDFIFSLRESKIVEHAGLNIYSNQYQPDGSIFGQINERRDWVNDTQFFVSNPYLLVITSSANKVNALMPFCGVSSVQYSDSTITAEYRGEAARKWFRYVYDYYKDQYSGIVRLWFVNAKDAGFKYASIDFVRSANVDFSNSSSGSVVGGIYTNHEFFHVGRYAKNNISPADGNARIKLIEKNARTVIYVKLWRERPEKSTSPEEFGYVIVIEP